MKYLIAALLLTMTTLAESPINRPWIQIAVWQPDATIRVDFSNVSITDVIQVQRLNGGMKDAQIVVNVLTLSRTQMDGQPEVIAWFDNGVFQGGDYSYRVRIINGAVKGPWSFEVRAIQPNENIETPGAVRHSILPSRGMRHDK